MSSWLERLAHLYGVHVDNLLEPTLCVPAYTRHRIDHDPPPRIFATLAQRAGIEPAQLRAMTFPGWVPWLFDVHPVEPNDTAEVFRIYVRQDSVLIGPRAAARPTAMHRPWHGPWIPADPLNRRCPRCAAETGVRALTWELPITIGCTEHRCRLEFPGDRIRPARTPHGEQPQPVSVPEPLATLENYTHQALAAGLVELPGRTVHAGVWFRLLRSLLDELSLAVTTTNRTTRRTLELIWDTAGLPLRAGICVWRPYEQLPWTVQEQLLTAAAVAVQLVTERTIIARGTLGPVLVEPAPQRVYAGDGPRRRPVTGPDLAAAFEAWIRSARTRPERARQILWNLAAVRPTDPEHLHRERRYLIDKGIPPEFLHQDEPPGSSSTSPRDDRRPARAGNDDHRT